MVRVILIDIGHGEEVREGTNLLQENPLYGQGLQQCE